MTVLWCIIALVCAGLGIASIVIPEDMIYIREHARFMDFDPTERYIRMERIKGAFLVAFAIVIIICLIIL